MFFWIAALPLVARMTEKAYVGFTDLESFTRLHVNILSVFNFGLCMWIAALPLVARNDGGGGEVRNDK
jgi:hypothetical protein